MTDNTKIHGNLANDILNSGDSGDGGGVCMAQ